MQEFIGFLSKSNAIALAIGVIIGGAATKLVNALVEYILNPIIGKLVGGIDLKNALKIGLGNVKDEKTGEMVENSIKIGALISTLIDFVIIMFVVFMIAKAVAPDLVK